MFVATLAYQPKGNVGNVGRVSGECRESVGRMSGECRENVGGMSGECRENVGSGETRHSPDTARRMTCGILLNNRYRSAPQPLGLSLFYLFLYTVAGSV